MIVSYPALSVELAEQLAAVPITNGLYRPSLVELDDGTTLDRVYMVGAAAFLQLWGENADADGTGRAFVPVQRITAIVDSPCRLPARAADKLYAAGESRMGATIFTVCFRDGSRMAVVSGNAIDFVDYPTGQSAKTVVNVLPHAGIDDPARKAAPDHAWCLYSDA
jgi:hypothetical protein